MRFFAFKPTLTMKGRKNKGLRGLSGKPTHPPLTDVPIGAYVLAAILDIISLIGGDGSEWSKSLWQAGAFMFAVGLIATIPTVITGLVDRQTSSEPGTQAWRTINSHAILMVAGTVLALINFIWRISMFNDEAYTPVGVMILSIITALVIAVGATYGGSLVFDYGFNVETAGDHPVWHKSEEDVFPGDH